MDLVVNHTSAQHAWFKESRSSKTNPKASYYIWRPAKMDAAGKRLPPNNWRSVWGDESAWQWDETREEYYLMMFTGGQPDLNWENQTVREEVYDLMHFWLKKGADGFRVGLYFFRSREIDAGGLDGRHQPDLEARRLAGRQHYTAQRQVSAVVRAYSQWVSWPPHFSSPSISYRPRVHEFLKEMNQKVLSRASLHSNVNTTYLTQITTL
jgi:glycosidase